MLRLIQKKCAICATVLNVAAYSAGFAISASGLLSCEKTTKVTLAANPPTVVPAPVSACPNGGVLVQGVPVCNGANGSNGNDGVGVGVLTYPSLSCANGGVNVEFFRDFNNDGVKNGADYVVSVSSVCNGTNGTDGVVNIGTATAAQCHNGGITVNGAPVCNGLNGLNGTDANLVFGTPTLAQCPYGGITVNGHPVCNGAPGVSPTLTIVSATLAQCPTGGIVVNGNPVCNGAQGPQGPAGDGGVLAAKLCPTDNSATAEYGLIVGGELYAVLYGSPSSHPHTIGLIRVSPGTYTTTTGTPKTFTYSKSGSTISLTCDSVTVNYDTGSGSGSGTLSGATCTIQKTADYGTEKHYSNTVSGSGLAGDYKLEYTFNNNSFMSESSCTGFGVWTNNSCASSQYQISSGHKVSFTPIGSAMGFTTYVKGNTPLIITSAKLIKISTGQWMQCNIINSTSP